MPHFVVRFAILPALCLLMDMNGLFAQVKKYSTEEYIELYKDIAVQEMHKYKIPASITLAQGILESGSGNSDLARHANNHFGIKCHVGWKGRSFYMDDDEKNECFRAYKTPEESYEDHAAFLTQRPRYAFLFDLNIKDYKAWAHGLSKAGYATNPLYPELLIRIIEKYSLEQYDHQTHKKANHEQVKPTDVPRHVFVPVDTTQFQFDENAASGRRVYVNNGKKLVFAVQGDDIPSLAHEFAIYSWQIAKYNELSKSDSLRPGQVIYLQKKRNKASKQKTHTLKEGETLYGISQQYGIRLKALMRKNKLDSESGLKAGKPIILR